MQIYLAEVEPEFCWTNPIYLLHKYYFNIDYDQSSTNKHCFSSEMNTNMLFATHHNHITCCFFCSFWRFDFATYFLKYFFFFLHVIPQVFLKHESPNSVQ